jgi:hypothetical protein
MEVYQHRRAGSVWKLSGHGAKNSWVQNLKCKGCEKGFTEGQYVVLATTTPRRHYTNRNNGYARIRHIECFVDAKGRQIEKIPK